MFDQLFHHPKLTRLRQAQFILAVVIYSALLLMPNPNLGAANVSDTTLHALGNAILMLSIWLASGNRFKAHGPLIFVVPFSIFMELAQGLTDNRTPELSDFLANIAGALFGYLICLALSKLFLKK